MREAGRLVGEVLTELAAHVAPGVSTADLDALAEKRIRAAGATPAFKGYHGYPATICASINDEVIHGIPSGRRVLQEGDIISIDVGASLDGYFGDSAITLPVGQVSEEAATLLRVTDEALYKAIEQGRSAAGFGHQRSGAAARRSVRVFGRAGVRRPRHRAEDARGAAGAQLRRARARAAAGRGHGARHRADGERAGKAGGESARRRVDGGDARRQPVGALRAHGGGDGRRAVDSDGERSRRPWGASRCGVGDGSCCRAGSIGWPSTRRRRSWRTSRTGSIATSSGCWSAIGAGGVVPVECRGDGSWRSRRRSE